jgi:hypothetical protein
MKSFHISAYTYKADIWCCGCVAEMAEEYLQSQDFTMREIENLVTGPGYDCGVSAYRSESLLLEMAELKNINLRNHYSFDSDDFPKVVFADQMENQEYCGNCMEKI